MEILFTTKRLFLRRFTPDDAQLIYELNLDPEVTRYTGDPVHNLDHAKKVLEENILPQYSLYNLGRWAVYKKNSNHFIGWCGLKYRPERDETDLGYRFMKEYWSQGYAYEAASACIEYGFSVLHLQSITGRAMPANTASWRVLEKCGMKFIKEEIVDDHPAKTYIINTPYQQC